jgi:DNA-binding response OmpR family regulator
MRILVIEDEPRILSFLARGLNAEGYTVRGASDGREGLTLARDGGWDLIVLDLLLPELHGLDVLRQLRRDQPDVPVVILSAHHDLPTKLRGFELGAADFVAKPFSLEELLARIRVHVRRVPPIADGRSGGAGNGARAGRLVLDFSRRQARLGDATSDLSDREFRLLQHLVRHENEVVSRERLLGEVWGYGFDPGSNVVEVCIRRLRKKLGPDAPIETVRNAGYRLVT